MNYCQLWQMMTILRNFHGKVKAKTISSAWINMLLPPTLTELLRVLMDNFSADQYERFEAYRRHALSKGAVRKVIQQTLGQQVSQPVAQIIAGFSKVFVGEIVEKGGLFSSGFSRLNSTLTWSKCSASSTGATRRHWTSFTRSSSRSLQNVSARDWTCRCCAASQRQETVRALASQYPRCVLRCNRISFLRYMALRCLK